MKTILVPTDFSDAARNASKYAINLAKSLNYKVLLVHVVNFPVLASHNSFEMGETIDIAEIENEHTIKLKKEAADLAANSGVVVDCKTLTGFTIDEISDIEQSEKPNLIVMGLNPEGNISDFIFGSITTDVVKNTQTPVLIVPEKTKYKKIEKIVFASDLKMECEMQMHDPLEDLINCFNSDISILNIVKEQTEKIGKDDGVSGRRIEKYFENKKHVYHFLENNDIIAGISEFIVSQDIDMITMIPQKHNLIERLFKESNIRNMAFHIDIPLLTLPAVPC